MEEVRIFVAEQKPAVRQAIERMVRSAGYSVVGEEFRTGDEAEAIIRAIRPEFVVMSAHLLQKDGFAVGKVCREELGVAFALYSPRTDGTVTLAALRSGAEDILTSPFSQEELVTIIQDCMATRFRGRGKDGGVPSERSGIVLAFHGPKAGVGTSTVLANLALRFLKHYSRQSPRVAIVDLDMAAGTQAWHFKMESKAQLYWDGEHLRVGRNLYALKRNEEKPWTEEGVLQYALRREDVGIDLYASPMSARCMIDGAEFDPEEITHLLKILRRKYDVVFVDTPSVTDSIILSLAQIAYRTLLVVDPTVVSMDRARISAGYIRDMEVPLERVLVIPNKFTEPPISDLKLDDINAGLFKDLGVGLLAPFPLEPRLAMETFNKGNPILSPDQASPELLGRKDNPFRIPATKALGAILGVHFPTIEQVNEEAPARWGVFGNMWANKSTFTGLTPPPLPQHPSKG